MKGQQMSANTVSVVTESDETAEVSEDTTPEVSPTELAEAAIARLDDTNPVKAMVLAARQILSTSKANIDTLVDEVKRGSDDVENQISDIIEDATEESDPVLFAKRDEAAKLQAALDEANDEMKQHVISTHNIAVMSDEDVKAKRDAISEARSNFKASVSASEKMLRNMLPATEVAMYFVDINAPKSLGGGATGTGGFKPRLSAATVTLNGEAKSVTPRKDAKGNDAVSMGEVVKLVNDVLGFTEATNRISTADLTGEAREAGIESNSEVTFDFTPDKAQDKTLSIHLVKRG